MRRTVVLVTVTGVVLAIAVGVAVSGQPFTCDGPCVGGRLGDTMIGSAGQDIMAAMEGNDFMDGAGDGDFLYGDEGNDTIIDVADSGDVDMVYGDQGNDTINVRESDPFSDNVSCGPGKKDKVFFDKGSGADKVAKNCEIKRGTPVPTG